MLEYNYKTMDKTVFMKCFRLEDNSWRSVKERNMEDEKEIKYYILARTQMYWH